MFIQNLRLGHATNSSSSHSIVVMRPGQPRPLTDWEPERGSTYSYRTGIRADRVDTAQFGWDNFILADTKSKMMYLATTCSRQYDSWEEMREEFRPFLSDEDLQACWHGYVDHESVGVAHALPRDLLLRPEVVVLGGNDNEDSRFMIEGADKIPRFFTTKRDKGAIILYDPKSGFKIRMAHTPYEKATTPELVDVKITDYCPYGCQFCYQGSTREGTHAPLERIQETARALGEMGVFEVALGGGEPMMHPDFPLIVQAFRDAGITPNATTFGVEWTKRPALIDAARQLGGIGVSVQNADALAKVYQINQALRGADRWGRQSVQVMAQHAVGSGDLEGIIRSLENRNEDNGYYAPHLLLLGFKNVGRGVSGPQHPVSSEDMKRLLASLERNWDGNPVIQFSIDTAFIDQYPDVLSEMHVPYHMLSSPEGKFSMYIDLVENKMGPSSYCEDKDYVAYTPDTIVDAFARW